MGRRILFGRGHAQNRIPRIIGYSYTYTYDGGRVRGRGVGEDGTRRPFPESNAPRSLNYVLSECLLKTDQSPDRRGRGRPIATRARHCGPRVWTRGMAFFEARLSVLIFPIFTFRFRMQVLIFFVFIFGFELRYSFLFRFQFQFRCTVFLGICFFFPKFVRALSKRWAHRLRVGKKIKNSRSSLKVG